MNPWQQIDFSNEHLYALKDELNTIKAFNSRCDNKDYKIHLDIIPEPYIGNPNTCSILLLNLNPGYSSSDTKFHSKNSYFRSISVKNLLHESLNYPFYLLDPKISDSPGSLWWRKKFAELIKLRDIDKIANSIAVIEYFPYHSEKYKDIGMIFESQNYSFDLVRKCMKRGIAIILMRSFRKWFGVILGLNAYTNLFYCRSVQNPTISSGNLSQYVHQSERKKKKEDPNSVFNNLTELIE